MGNKDSRFEGPKPIPLSDDSGMFQRHGTSATPHTRSIRQLDQCHKKSIVSFVILAAVVLSVVVGLMVWAYIQTSGRVATDKVDVDPQATFVISFNHSEATISYDLDRQRFRIDFRTEHSAHASLYDWMTCQLYEVDWHSTSADYCQIKNLTFSMCSPDAVNQTDRRISGRRVTSKDEHVVEQFLIDDTLLVTKLVSTNSPILFHDQSNSIIYTVSRYSPTFDPQWDAVVEFCQTGSGSIAPMSGSSAQLMRIDQDGRDWTILSMESHCTYQQVRQVLPFLDGDLVYGNQCKLDSSNPFRACPDFRVCPNDTLDEWCDQVFYQNNHRSYLGVPIGTCHVNSQAAAALANASICDVASAACNAARPIVAMTMACMPCDELVETVTIFPKWHHRFFWPELFSTERWTERMSAAF